MTHTRMCHTLGGFSIIWSYGLIPLGLVTPLVVLDLELEFSLVSYGQFSPVSFPVGEDLFGVCVQCLGLCFVSGMHELEVYI